MLDKEKMQIRDHRPRCAPRCLRAPLRSSHSGTECTQRGCQGLQKEAQRRAAPRKKKRQARVPVNSTWDGWCDAQTRAAVPRPLRDLLRFQMFAVLLAAPFGFVSCPFAVWEECILPEGKTPRLAEAQGIIALALSTWKEEFRSEYR